MARFKTLERPPENQLPPMRLTKRDFDIIKTVYDYRAMTTPQIEVLLFPADDPQATHGKKTRCQLRLRLLFQHGYLWRGEQPTRLLTEGRKPLVYRIDKQGVELLPELLGIEPEEVDWKPKELTVSDLYLNHLLRTNDARVAIEAACRRHGVEIKTWLDDRTLKSDQAKDYVIFTGPQGGRQKAAIVPDGYFHLWTGDKNLHNLLEADLATVVGMASKSGRRDWSRKVRAYMAYYQKGLYKKRYGTDAGRVLTVTTGEKRLANLKRLTEEAGGRVKFWFTTFDQLTPQTALTGRIWQVASLAEPQPLIKDEWLL